MAAVLHEDNLRELIVSSLFARILEQFNGLIRLAEAGWPAPTQVVVRALIEAVFTLRAVAEHDDILERYQHEDDYQRLALLKKLERSAIPKMQQLCDPELKASLEESVRSLPVRGPLRTDFLAGKAGLLEWYLIVYACLTGPAHSKIRDLQRYIQTSHPEPLSFSLQHTEDDTLGLLSTAGNAVLFAVESFQKVFDVQLDDGLEEFRDAFHEMGRSDV